MMKIYQFNDLRIELLVGNIVDEQVDAIVNAANAQMVPGGGVDGAINLAGGPELSQAQRAMGSVKTGAANLTQGYNLPAKYVIHAVGPIWHGGYRDEAKLLREAYENSLQIAQKWQFKSIAFPAISTGVYGFPLELAAKIVYDVVAAFSEQSSELRLVRLVMFDQKAYDAYVKAFLNEPRRE